MINEGIFAEFDLNTGEAPFEATSGVLTLNGLDIATGNIKVVNISDITSQDLNAFDIPQDNGRGFLSYFKRGRTISMTVYIKGSTESEFITNLDTFRKNCYTKNVNLDWKRDGVVRRIKVNCTSNPQVFQHYNIDFLKVDVTFESLEPFWYKLDNQSTSIFSISASFQEEITNVGTAESQVVAYLLFGATNTTQVKMQIGENEIIVDHTFSNNDILKIDGVNKRVYVGETAVDYSGVFPFMGAGTNFFTFTINGTFTCDVLVLNRINYV